MDERASQVPISLQFARLQLMGVTMAKPKLIGQQSGEYFVLTCEQCKAETDNEYLGDDGAMPSFAASCRMCGSKWQFKFNDARWSRLPGDPMLR